jgi:hypothetical protein
MADTRLFTRGSWMEILDHALVRYIERVKGVSLDAYREELNALVASAEWRDEGKPDDGFVMVAWKGRLKTILPQGARGKRDKFGNTRFATLDAPGSVRP